MSGRCRCTADSACASNQTCTEGVCKARVRCRQDAECTGGTRCEVTQGLCVPTCRLPTDCAPNLDPQVALGLYACLNGTCARRCATDLTCAADGVICRDGLCASAECKTKADCTANQYCSSSNFGRCLTYETCSSSTECDDNFRCQKFGQNECPPGFDCTLSICRELPRCFIDSDCVSGVPGTMQSMQNGFCDEGHCQPTRQVPHHDELHAGPRLHRRHLCSARLSRPRGVRRGKSLRRWRLHGSALSHQHRATGSAPG